MLIDLELEMLSSKSTQIVRVSRYRNRNEIQIEARVNVSAIEYEAVSVRAE